MQMNKETIDAIVDQYEDLGFAMEEYSEYNGDRYSEYTDHNNYSDAYN